MHRWRGPAATAADCNSATEKHRRFESSRHHYPPGRKQADQQVAAPSRPCCGFRLYTVSKQQTDFIRCQASLVSLTANGKSRNDTRHETTRSGRLRSSNGGACMVGGSNPPGATFLTGLTTGESRTVKKNWKSVQILGRTLGRGGFAGG